MAYKLAFYGNEILRQKAKDVLNIDQDIIDLIRTLQNIMYKEKGIGLAAPQINISKKIITIDIEKFNGPAITLINPEIIKTSDNMVPYEEGCLSVPGIAHEVIRPSEILVKGVDKNGNEIELEADGLLARVLQHEIDHLDGILFVDRLQDFIRKEYRSELKKIKKLNKE